MSEQIELIKTISICYFAPRFFNPVHHQRTDVHFDCLQVAINENVVGWEDIKMEKKINENRMKYDLKLHTIPMEGDSGEYIDFYYEKFPFAKNLRSLSSYITNICDKKIVHDYDIENQILKFFMKVFGFEIEGFTKYNEVLKQRENYFEITYSFCKEFKNYSFLKIDNETYDLRKKSEEDGIKSKNFRTFDSYKFTPSCLISIEEERRKILKNLESEKETFEKKNSEIEEKLQKEYKAKEEELLSSFQSKENLLTEREKLLEQKEEKLLAGFQTSFKCLKYENLNDLQAAKFLTDDEKRIICGLLPKQSNED